MNNILTRINFVYLWSCLLQNPTTRRSKFWSQVFLEKELRSSAWMVQRSCYWLTIKMTVSTHWSLIRLLEKKGSNFELYKFVLKEFGQKWRLSSSWRDNIQKSIFDLKVFAFKRRKDRQKTNQSISENWKKRMT